MLIMIDKAFSLLKVMKIPTQKGEHSVYRVVPITQR